MLITGIGVFPDSKLASDAGIETQRADGGAILVDDMMRTSDGDVYAIGDVAIRRDQALAVESVHNAQETASIAAAAITKTDAPTIQTPGFGLTNTTLNFNLLASSQFKTKRFIKW